MHGFPGLVPQRLAKAGHNAEMVKIPALLEPELLWTLHPLLFNFSSLLDSKLRGQGECLLTDYLTD